jgi:hypothetical protein
MAQENNPRLDIASGGSEISIFAHPPRRIGIYVKDDDGPAVFYADKGQVLHIIDILEKLIENK